MAISLSGEEIAILDRLIDEAERSSGVRLDRKQVLAALLRAACNGRVRPGELANIGS